MSPPFIRSPYNYDVEAASNESAYTETMPSLTVQSQTEDTDLNVLMKRFGVTGKMPENVRMPTYGDFTHVSDYRSAIHAARVAEESFNQFPADIRAQFDNNPQLFLDFVEDPRNASTVVQWFPNDEVLRAREQQRQAAGGGSPPQGDLKGSPFGAGAPAGGTGTQLPERPDKSGK